MSRQNEMAKPRLRTSDEREQRHHHRQETHAGKADRQRDFERACASAERRNDDHLGRSRPYEDGRKDHPSKAKAIIVRKRPNAHVGAEEHDGEDGCPRRASPGEKCADAGIAR